jgi:hypothetical protein
LLCFRIRATLSTGYRISLWPAQNLQKDPA